ncbi:helix-turn-helix domain-containing protein [Rhizobium sp. CFBP 8762]|uniref:helix-turn-helix domain-containing protein n=1 Tax=Rhizobium sp. CFBP 8762 TaxID=2775279 RepID=UPI00177C4982|nr:helix-turn-helix domain-containing protein [Rhizobium sp. CFBP 8762]MBD8554879.1 helix-turn-helix domain-containing protein [Rhizobium sp. CFBP 8762]
MAKKRSDRLTEQQLEDFRLRLREVLGAESETQFARRANLAKSGLNRILKDGTPSMDVLIAIADAGGVNVGWLANGKGAKFLNNDTYADATHRHQGQPIAAVTTAQEDRFHKGLPLKRGIMTIVSEVHSDAGIFLPPDEVALIGMEIYAELKSTVADLDDAEEVDLALAHIRHKLKRSALNAIQNPGLGKAEAS